MVTGGIEVETPPISSTALPLALRTGRGAGPGRDRGVRQPDEQAAPRIINRLRDAGLFDLPASTVTSMAG